jgi:serine/threonine protein kinase
MIIIKCQIAFHCSQTVSVSQTVCSARLINLGDYVISIVDIGKIVFHLLTFAIVFHLMTFTKTPLVASRGLMHIHRMKIIHRDVKSANCLVDKHWTVKICDFGLSRIITDSPMRDSSSAGTPEWMAPELIRNEPFTEKCDIFSLGVIMWELCTLNRPWEGVPPERVC